MKRNPDQGQQLTRAATLQVPRTARYGMLGEADRCNTLWTCIHGYGQLADAFLQEVSILGTDDRAVVAPEALSRFYLAGSRGAVGASWMTSHARRDEIGDYVRYLDALRDVVCAGRKADDAPVHVALGFSQGTATVTRWLAQTSKRADAVVLWGGTVARDVDDAGLEQLRAIKHRYIVFGDADRYADEARITSEMQILTDRNLPFTLVRFKGGHAIEPNTLLALAEQIEGDLAN